MTVIKYLSLATILSFFWLKFAPNTEFFAADWNPNPMQETISFDIPIEMSSFRIQDMRQQAKERLAQCVKKLASLTKPLSSYLTNHYSDPEESHDFSTSFDNATLESDEITYQYEWELLQGLERIDENDAYEDFQADVDSSLVDISTTSRSLPDSSSSSDRILSRDCCSQPGMMPSPNCCYQPNIAPFVECPQPGMMPNPDCCYQPGMVPFVECPQPGMMPSPNCCYQPSMVPFVECPQPGMMPSPNCCYQPGMVPFVECPQPGMMPSPNCCYQPATDSCGGGCCAPLCVPVCCFWPYDSPYLGSGGLLLRFAGTIGESIGTKRDYTTVGLRASQVLCCAEVFLDGRWHYFSDRKNAANAGLGIRYTNDCFHSILGANLYYDYREGRYQDFHQVSGGLEFFHPCYRIYINGYYPLNKKRCNKLCCIYDDDYWVSIDRCQYTMRGADAEIDKTLFCYCNSRISGGIGVYYYDDTKHDRTVGGRLRLTAELYKYVYFELEGTYDKMFDSKLHGTLALNFPIPCPSLKRNNNCCCQPWCPPIPQHRNDFIILRKCEKWQWNYDDCDDGWDYYDLYY